MRRVSRTQRFRSLVQIGFFALVALIVISHSLDEAGIVIPLLSGASLHAICPFGGVVTLYRLITEGSLIQKIHSSSLVLTSLVLLSALLFGPLFCGWVCPFGTFQKWLAPLGRRIFGRRYGKIIPARFDRVLRYLRYVVLIWVVVVTALSAKLFFADYDPYFALFNFWTGEVALTAFIALAAVMLLTMITERPFCKYACPYGALLGVTNFFRVFSIRRSSSTCISCGACDGACPMGITVSTAGRVRDHQCISCMKCSSEEACPVDHTVEMSIRALETAGSRIMRPSSKFLGAAMILIMFGGIGFSMAAGWWSTKSTKVPRRISSGELAGSYDPADIRGSYSLADIERSFGVSPQFIADSYLLETGSPAGITAKNIEETYSELLAGSPLELGTDSVRWVVSLYLGFPYTSEETTGLPKPGLDLLLEAGRITPEQHQQLSEGFGVDLSVFGETKPPVSAVPDAPAAPAALEIKGKTTFAEVLAAGVSASGIERILGAPMPADDAVIRDVCLELGLEFSAFREEIYALLQ